MTKKKIDLDLSKEFALLENELDENEKIFKQVKVHYDRILASANPASRFITEQTANIMNIRNSRISIIKEMIGIKKAEAEMDLKEYNATKLENNSENMFTEVSKQIYEMLKTDKKEGSIEKLLNNCNIEEQKNENNNEEDLLEKRMKEIEEKRNNKAKEEKQEIPHIFACDMEKNIYAITTDGSDIVEGVEIPDIKVNFVTDELTGDITALTENGEELPIIEIE